MCGIGPKAAEIPMTKQKEGTMLSPAQGTVQAILSSSKDIYYAQLLSRVLNAGSGLPTPKEYIPTSAMRCGL